MGGIEFLKTAKEDPALAQTPIAMLTTSQERQDIIQSFDLHAAGYVVKPSNYAGALEALKIIEGYWSLNYLPACQS